MTLTSYLKSATDDELAAAVEENDISFWNCLSALPRCSWNDDGRLIWFSTGVPWANRVLRARLLPDETDEQIARIVAYFRNENLPFEWTYGPGSMPQELGSHLENHGLVPLADHPSPGMALALDTLDDIQTSPSDLAIQEVRDSVTLVDQWATTFNTGYESMPEQFTQAVVTAFASAGLGPESAWQHILGWLADKPVATSTIHYGAGVAGIYAVAAVPEVRRRGIGTAITSAALLAAKRRGYKYAVLTSSRIAAGVYQAIGFRQYCSVGRYQWTPKL